MEQSLKKIGGNGHDLSSFIGTQFMQDNKDIKLPPDVRNEIYKGMATYFSKIFTPNNNEEWKKLLKAFYVIDDLSENTFTYETDFEHTISDSSVSDAFFSGRYGHLENYIPNLDALYNLAHSIRASVKKYYFNAISISNGYITGSLRYVFPDQNSKIYVFDEKNELTRVYTLENDIDFLSKQFEKSLNDDKNEEHKKLSICPEYGVKKIKEIDGHFFKNKDDLLLPTDYLLVKNGTESIIICKIDNQLKGYIYKNGIIFESNEEILPKYSQLINKYEIERKNGKYAGETQMIKESIFDEKGLKKQSKEYKRYLDYRLSTNVYAYKKRTLKLIRYASLSLKGAKVFRGNIGKKLLNNTNSLLNSAKKEIDLFTFFSDNEMKRINEERETDYLKFRRDVETIFTDKLVDLYILENNLGNEELLEAIKDKYGIGKAIISKIKGLFKGKGER